MKKETLYNRRYYETHPWAKAHKCIATRCSPSGKYFKKGIVNYLSTADLKYLWFRDKAYLMKQPSIDRKDSKGNYTIENCRYVEFLKNSLDGVISRWKDLNKLTPDLVRKIRKIEGMKQIDIARMFGVDQTTISRIKRGAGWKNVT